MARIKIAYLGGGSTRGPGTMASLIEQGENFAGSEVVLIDLLHSFVLRLDSVGGRVKALLERQDLRSILCDRDRVLEVGR
jgi:alpha-galactosidase/6-phospho-beta-glucosidase family protein